MMLLNKPIENGNPQNQQRCRTMSGGRVTVCPLAVWAINGRFSIGSYDINNFAVMIDHHKDNLADRVRVRHGDMGRIIRLRPGLNGLHRSFGND